LTIFDKILHKTIITPTKEIAMGKRGQKLPKKAGFYEKYP
jgi:hypothetical protein